MRKRHSRILFVHHAQVNNPIGLAPAQPVTILNNRSAILLDENKKYRCVIKSVKTNVAGLDLNDTEAEALLNSFRSDFTGFLSVIEDETGLKANLLDPAKHTAQGGALQVSNQKVKRQQMEFLVNAHEYLFSETSEASSTTNANVYGQYYLPVPQAGSVNKMRSDAIPLVEGNIVPDVEFLIERQRGFLVPNFVSNHVTSSVDIDPVTGQLSYDYFKLYQGNAAPSARKVSIYLVQYWIELWEL